MAGINADAKAAEATLTEVATYRHSALRSQFLFVTLPRYIFVSAMSTTAGIVYIVTGTDINLGPLAPLAPAVVPGIFGGGAMAAFVVVKIQQVFRNRRISSKAKAAALEVTRPPNGRPLASEGVEGEAIDVGAESIEEQPDSDRPGDNAA